MHNLITQQCSLAVPQQGLHTYTDSEPWLVCGLRDGSTGYKSVPAIQQWLRQGRMSDGTRGFAPFRGKGDDGKKKKKRSKFAARRSTKAIQKSHPVAHASSEPETVEDGPKPQGIITPAVSWLKDLLPSIDEDAEEQSTEAAAVFSDAEHRRLKARRVHERLTALEQEFAVERS